MQHATHPLKKHTVTQQTSHTIARSTFIMENKKKQGGGRGRQSHTKTTAAAATTTTSNPSPKKRLPGGRAILFCVLSFHLIASPAASASQEQSTLETYIVHVELPEFEISHSTSNEVVESWYKSFLPTNNGSSNEAPRMVYSYHNVFKGFAAKLSAEEVHEMEKKPGFLSAQPQKVLSLHTTHSPSFLGLHRSTGFWNESNYGKGVIIGMVDSGITPDHPSFGDEGMPPPPAHWKGKCEFNTSICNNKLIGARSFSVGEASCTPVDDDGHGSHTSSTAAGNFVRGANVFGNAKGTAVGIAPLAHLAMYKIPTGTGYFETDVLAAMDAAIDDGVDILSLSLGTLLSEPFYADNMALGAYSAMEKGILVSCSAGNTGPQSSSIVNDAPWILTVGASSTDRKIRATVVLGNHEQLDAESVYQSKDFPSTLFPLSFFHGNNTIFHNFPEFCLEEIDMKGKIAVCGFGEIQDKVRNVKANGAIGMIVVDPAIFGYIIPLETHAFPTIYLNYANQLKLFQYINSTSSPMAGISFKGTLIGDPHAPEVAFFSARGPSIESPGILKPDIIGPGLGILGAWNGPVGNNNITTKSNFNIISGTSMSCPHLSGVAALLKSAHPDWSPAAIKSAIMTTADVVNLAGNPIEDQREIPADIFAIGAGHVNPARASNPGLIYDIEPNDYIPYLCGLKYTNKEVSKFLKRKVDCKKESSIPEAQLNYPSFSLVLASSQVQKYTRTVTNVGEAYSIYNVHIDPPTEVNVEVNPSTLSFTEVNQKLTYEVTFSRTAALASDSTRSQGSLIWTSSKYSVRSPIAVVLV